MPITIPGLGAATPLSSFSWVPASSDVAKFVPQRVSDTSGDFTTDTVPPVADVNELIVLVANLVFATIGDIDTTLYGAAALVTAVGVAFYIEAAWTSNEAEETSPRLEALRKDYQSLLDRLATAAREGAGQGTPDAEFSFPDLTSTDETPFGQFQGGMSWSTNF